ncbi:hypothetical protein A2Y99_01805 [Candidatus Gottesmanbacteria bacterium RBG_13_37_7]|uniref:Uncharacterized protein n=1 Tax=Candidatus Gottesmanbacteria bacterium RBG_13_37_7 TaxID=1798369 RepID=A0A1F5YHW4_9BACT|nr:MAG: hypothetical protein A2Y99_01805 [Candidatus Gottesmanbacteria bacterium RBG_13_37_7]
MVKAKDIEPHSPPGMPVFYGTGEVMRVEKNHKDTTRSKSTVVVLYVEGDDDPNELETVYMTPGDYRKLLRSQRNGNISKQR